MNKNKLDKFIDEISLSSESKNEIYQIIVPLVLSKKVFRNSKELKLFTIEIIDLDLADYVYRSRALLLGRIMKYINDLSIEESVKINYKIVEFIKSIQNINGNLEYGNKNTNKKSSFFSDWNNLINERNEI